jgi:hypothetical protein
MAQTFFVVAIAAAILTLTTTSASALPRIPSWVLKVAQFDPPHEQRGGIRGGR